MKKDLNLKLKLNTFYLMFYGSFGCYYPFLQVYFSYKGLSYTKIGVALAVNSLVGVICQPIWGYITDKYSYKKKVLLQCMFFCSIIIWTFVYVNNFELILLCTILLVIFQSPISPVADAYCYDLMEDNKNINYGQIRLMGSMGYAVMALVMGFIIKIKDIKYSFYIYSIIFIIAILTLRSIDFRGKTSSNRVKLQELKQLMTNKVFLIFISTITIASIALGANGSYLPVLIKATGGDVSKLGILWFVLAMSEIPAFFFGSKLLKKVGALKLYAICLIFYIIRFMLDSVCTSYELVIVTQLTQAITYPLFLVSAMDYINEMVPLKMKTSGITIFSAIGMGLGNFIGNIGGGILLEKISVFLVFRLFALVCLIAFFISLILRNISLKSK